MKLLMMTKNVNVCLLSLFHIILLINIIFCYLVMHEKWSGLSNNNLKWVKKAAKEVGEVASMSCSGHGKAFLDGWVIDGEEQPVCECYACFTGPFCSHFSRPCIADADSGNPMFLEPFWTNEEETSGIIVPGWHRMSYTYPDERSMSIQLEKYVRKLHALVGNAITDGIHIVFGTGSTQLFNAAVHALSSKSTVVVASIPFYHLYKEQTDFFQSPFYNFKGDASLWKNRTEVEKNTTFVEFVTSPNNPDGELKDAVLQGPSVKTIYDRVYYWPFYTPISAPAVDDLMLFSISKLTGHAGSRFGYI